MIASAKGHLDVVKTLIEAEANVNHTNKVGKHCVVHVHVHLHTFLLYHRLLCTCLHVCHNDAMHG